jgi:ABC-type antimicrobial peptide transport system permease subunit
VRTILAAEAPRVEPAITTARRHVDAALSQEWLAATAATAIAGLALVLAIVGLYGIVRYTVAQRTREIGIRVALGATPRAIVRLALGDAAWTLVPGAAVGLAALVPVALTIRPLLHDVGPFDGAVLAASIALTAVGIPARAAGRIDPADALRLE